MAGSSRPPGYGLSPRVRGKLVPVSEAVGHLGSIPACAGETACHAALLRVHPVYPRVCGGNEADVLRRPLMPGLSPRVRGKHLMLEQAGRRIRSIPACAGETASARRERGLLRVYPRVCGGNPPQPHTCT